MSKLHRYRIPRWLHDAKRRSSNDRRISWHPTATGRSPGSHCWTSGRSPSGHRPKFRSSAKWIGRPPSNRLAVAGRRLVLDFYDPVQGWKNPVMICRCLKTGIGGKSGDHRTISKACDAAISADNPNTYMIDLLKTMKPCEQVSYSWYYSTLLKLV